MVTNNTTQPTPASMSSTPLIIRIANPIVIALLRSPLHRLLSKTVMLVTFTGRKSGKIYTTPISYIQDGNNVTALTHGRWWRNIGKSANVALHIKGRTIQATAEAIAVDKEAIATGIQAVLQRVPRDARFYHVTSFSPDGVADRTQALYGAQDAVMLRFHVI